MLEKNKMDRINELANKKKTTGLTDAETKEQKALREEYLKAFRKNFRDQLEHIEFTD